MKVKLIINDKEYEVEVTEDQVKELTKSSKPDHKRWRAKKQETYWYIAGNGTLHTDNEANWDYDKGRWSLGNYFKTKDEAEEYVKKIRYQQQYKDWCLDRSKPIDWENENQMKYSVYASHALKGVIDICFDLNSINKKGGTVYASDIEFIESFIKYIGEDNFKKYILEVDD